MIKDCANQPYPFQFTWFKLCYEKFSVIPVYDMQINRLQTYNICLGFISNMYSEPMKLELLKFILDAKIHRMSSNSFINNKTYPTFTFIYSVEQWVFA